MTEKKQLPSQYISDNLDSLVSEWEAISKAKVKAASGTHTLVLRDHIPNILQELQATLEEVERDVEPRKAAEREVSPNRSKEHGRHRASTEDYTVDQVIHEFIILRHVLIDRLTGGGVSDAATMETITHVLELGMLDSCAAFSESLELLQQKMVGTLAHDIRTPLTIADTSIELLDTTDLNPNEAKEVRQMARRGIKRALSMLRDLLDSIRVKAGEGIMMHFEETDYSREIHDACDGIKLVYGEQVKARLPEKTVSGVFCPAAIRRLLENLVSNAVKHGSRGTPIAITFEDLAEDVLLTVHNEGAPIPENEQARIFDFLATAPESHRKPGESWGIGLTLVKIVAEAHGGSVRIESEDGRGTTFIVTLNKRPHPPGQKRICLDPQT